MTLLVTGFGAFADVADNPSGRLARALDGARIGGVRIVGVELPVSYARSVELTLEIARARRPLAVLGTGVARSRTGPELERIARAALGPHPDVDGAIAPALAGPATLTVAHAEAWADALGCGLSDDAGGYVCNAWLHQVSFALRPLPVGFLHVPPGGVDPAWARRGLSALLSTLVNPDPSDRRLG